MHLTFQRELTFKTSFSVLKRFPASTGNVIALVYKPDESLAHLFQVTQDFLTENGQRIDHKPFRPHVTLGRIRKASIPDKLLNQQTDICLRVDKIVLYQSTLTDTGSIYIALKEIELGQTGDHLP